MNNRGRTGLLLMGAVIGSQTLLAADRLDDVLAHMDAAAVRFNGVRAQISYTRVTVVVNDKSTQSGGISLARDKKGYKILIEFREPDEEDILLKNNKVNIYKPKIAQNEEYDLGKENQDLVNQYLMVGFGGRVEDMKRGYDITLGGDATINGVNAVKLNLKPKGTLASKMLVELWISQTNWLPVQQRSTDPVTKDYTDVVYSNVQEQPLKDSVFDLHFKGNVKTVHPGR
jgi:outer membrane lipoprotein-sorting protein